MTREEAINKLIRIRQVQGSKSEVHEALGMAIDALAYQAEFPEGLEEAAHNHAANNGGRWLTDDIGIKCFAFNPQEVKDAFKAGAEYQRKQDQQLIELAEDHAMLAGMNKMKEEMMEKAVDGEVVGYDDGTGKFITVLEDLPDDSPYKVGDKVKVIVIPEE